MAPTQAVIQNGLGGPVDPVGNALDIAVVGCSKCRTQAKRLIAFEGVDLFELPFAQFPDKGEVLSQHDLWCVAPSLPRCGRWQSQVNVSDTNF